jgi:hypothetical protein
MEPPLIAAHTVDNRFLQDQDQYCPLHLLLDHPSDLFPSKFSKTNLYAFVVFTCVLQAPPINLIILQIFREFLCVFCAKTASNGKFMNDELEGI